MSFLPPLGALLLPLTALLQPALAANAYTTTNNELPKDNSPNCSCYVVQSGANSQTPEYFQYYRFYDFRNIQGAMTEAPPLINSTQVAGMEPTWQPNVFNSDAWNTDWGIQNWSKKATDDFPVPMNNSLANVYLGQEKDVSFLSLRTSREESYQTSAEIENHQKNLMHVSMRMYGRVKGDKGAVAGFFTFFDDSNESDVEILTRDPKDQIRYTNQPSVDKSGNEIQAASVGPTNLPRWDDWQTHRIDWLPKNSYWFLNDKQVAANSYSVPRRSSYLVLNMWSDGGEWSGNMSEGHSAEFQIQWIEMTFNTSGPYTGSQKEDKRDAEKSLFGRKSSEKPCQTVCKIDGVAKVGTPEVVSNVTSSAAGAAGKGVSWTLLVGVVGLVSM
ncbi:glycoside hydrolase family 16 protein, partial [Cucurbitaria berberidis CBS 394.84]